MKKSLALAAAVLAAALVQTGCAQAPPGSSGGAMSAGTDTAPSLGVAPEMDQESVRELQQQLQTAGYNPGPQSGLMNEMTRAAVRDFQRAKGLPVTGLVDRHTWDALLSASGTPLPGSKSRGEFQR